MNWVESASVVMSLTSRERELWLDLDTAVAFISDMASEMSSQCLEEYHHHRRPVTSQDDTDWVNTVFDVELGLSGLVNNDDCRLPVDW